MNRTLSLVVRIAGAMLCISLIGNAWPQSFPSKPVHIIVPFPPGGPTDYAARLISQRLPKLLGQPVIVENRTGGAGITATDYVAKSPADGHTLLVATVGVMVIAPHLFNNLPYDTIRDFSPITNLVSGPAVLVVHPSVPVHSLNELIALAKAKPGYLTYGSTGLGQISHLNGELFKLRAGVDILHVPYKGAAPLLPELLGGQVSMNFMVTVDGLNYIRAGRLRALAVTSLHRLPLLPEVPTMDESGLKGYDVSNWNGIWAPAKTPPAVVAQLNQEIAAVMRSDEVRALVEAQGNLVAVDTPARFSEFIAQEGSRWSSVIRDAHIKLD